jgi:hypothetical protein
VYNVKGVPALAGIPALVLTLKVFAIYSPYPSAIANGKALGSLSVIVPVTDILLVIAFEDISISNNSTLSVPSFIFTFNFPDVPLSTQIVPVATELGADPPICAVFKAPKIELSSALKVPNAWFASVTSVTCDICFYTPF